MFLIYCCLLFKVDFSSPCFSVSTYECVSMNGTPYVVNDLQSAYKDALLGKTIFASSANPTFEE